MASRSLAVLALLVAVLAVALLSPVAAGPCPQVGLRPDAWVRQVVAKLKTLNFSDERLAYLKQEVLNDTRAFSGDQVAAIMPTLIFADDMIKAMEFMLPYIISLNTTEIIEVVSTLTMSNDRMIGLRALKDTLNDATEQNKKLIATTLFFFSSDQAAALALLKDVVSRDCVFGTVTDKSATFVVDISGSMSTSFNLDGKAYTRLSYVKEHLNRVISEQLKPYQLFNLILFADYSWKCFPTSVNATAQNIKTALAFLARSAAAGSTDTYEAMRDAFSSSATTVGVYLLSDGLPNSGQAPQIISALPQWNSARPAEYKIKVFATAFLLGPDSAAYKAESAAFMQQVAKVTNGVYRHMDI